MIDLFGIRAWINARKEAKEADRLARVQAEKKAYQERKQRISAYIKESDNKKLDKYLAELRKDTERANKTNAECPLCHSHNVIHSIKRTKGEVHGEGRFHSSSSHFGVLVVSSSYNETRGKSKLDGEMDTLPVNKCKDCGHEWNVEKGKAKREDSAFSYHNCQYLTGDIEDYFDIKYDPYDVTDTYNSLEEKREAFFKRKSSYWYMKDYRYAPRCAIEYAVYYGINKSDIDSRFGDVNGKDKYSYVVPDELWEVVKKIIEWKGNEE